MEKISIISTMISWADLSPEEGLALVRDLIAKWSLKQEECFAVDLLNASGKAQPEATDGQSEEQKTSVSVPLVAKRRGRPKKVKDAGEAEKSAGLEVLSSKVQTKATDGRSEELKTPVSVPPVTKRRGRPKKVKVSADCEPRLTDADKKLIEEVEQEADVSSKDKVEKMISEAKSDSGLVNVSTYAPLKQQYSYAFLYSWNGKNVLSRQVLQDLMPVGIYIPYKRLMFGLYKGFVVSLYDEHVHTHIKDAWNEAESRFEPVGGENWAVMNSMQWAILKEISGEINQMLNKVGGDFLRAPYKTPSPRSREAAGTGKFRYTVEVK